MISNIPSTSEITPETAYLRRREFIKGSLLFAATSSGVGSTLLWVMRGLRAKDHEKGADTVTPDDQSALTVARHLDYASGEKNTSYYAVTNYNNFYEFGTDKSDPAANAGTLRPHPWHLTIEGEVAPPKSSILINSSSCSHWRSAFTGCVASKHGRWSSRGSASH